MQNTQNNVENYGKCAKTYSKPVAQTTQMFYNNATLILRSRLYEERNKNDVFV